LLSVCAQFAGIKIFHGWRIEHYCTFVIYSLAELIANISSGTDLTVFQPDEDPSTLSNPLSPDTNFNGISDGEEDKNGNGRLDTGETDPGATCQGMYTQAQLDSAIANAEAAKDTIIAVMFTQEQKDEAVKKAVAELDINSDGILTIEEAIHALQVLSLDSSN